MEKVGLVVFGFILAFIPKWLDRKRKIRSHWNAISIEVERIEIKTNELITAKIAAPLYRLPLKCYETSFSMLLTEGAVSKDEVQALEDFYDLVQDINRGLDQVAEAVFKDDAKIIDSESNRNFGKARQLIEGEDSLIIKVKIITNIKCKLSLIQY